MTFNSVDWMSYWFQFHFNLLNDWVCEEVFIKYDPRCCFHTLRVCVESSKVRNTSSNYKKSYIQVFIDDIMSVERLKKGYNSLHIACRECRKIKERIQ